MAVQIGKCQKCGEPIFLEQAHSCSQPVVSTSGVPARSRFNFRRLGWIVLIAAVIGGVRGILNVYSGRTAQEQLLRSIDKGTVVNDLGIDKLSPYDLMNRSRQAAGFDRSFVTGFSTSFLRRWPGSKLQFDDVATFSDLGGVLRITIQYRGLLAEEKPHAVEAEAREYFHSQGSADLNGRCYTALSKCDELVARLDAAEAALLRQVTASGVGGILPSDGACSIESNQTETKQSFDVATCIYTPGTVLSLSRSNLEEFRQGLGAQAQDPSTKELLQQRLQKPAQ